MSAMFHGVPLEYLAALQYISESRVARRGRQAKNARVRRKMAKASRRKNR